MAAAAGQQLFAKGAFLPSASSARTRERIAFGCSG
jgi:hypothetical protein